VKTIGLFYLPITGASGDRMVGVISDRDLIKAVSYASLASFTPLMRGKK